MARISMRLSRLSRPSHSSHNQILDPPPHLGEQVGIQSRQAFDLNDGPPIFTLPNEIFCAIFIFSRNVSLITTSGGIQTGGRPTEVNISQVCRLWRSISLNLPTLWDTYRYVRPSPYSPALHPKIRLETYLERSRLHSLDIWLNFRGDDRKTRYTFHNDMFIIVLSQFSRWRRVTFLLDDNFPLLAYCADLKGLDPVNLEHFTLCGQTTAQCTDDKRGFLTPTLFLGGARKLYSVRMETTSYGPCLPPLSNITTLRLERPGFLHSGSRVRVGIKSILGLFGISTLENLSIAGLSIFEPLKDIAPRLEKVVVRGLKDFRCGDHDIAELLSYIQIPHLQSLTLRDVRFPDLSAKSGLDLTNLILINCKVDWSSFSGRMYLVSSRITQLTVSENSEGTFHHHALTNFVAENDWPALTSLSCNIQSVSHLDMYLQLALSRTDIQPNFSLRVHQNLLDMWYQRTPDIVPHIDGVCIIKTWDSEITPLIPFHWPYAEDRADHPYDKADSDPFRIVSYH